MSAGGQRNLGECHHGNVDWKCQLCKLESHISDLVDALLSLYDCQNGSPLPGQHGKRWREAMDRAGNILKRTGPRAEVRSIMKVVINRCFGGFSLSPKAVARLCELQGRPCYFFRQHDLLGPYEPCRIEEITTPWVWYAFDVPNPNEVIPQRRNCRELSEEKKAEHNRAYESHHIDNRPGNRADQLLVQVVEELGREADGDCAKLAIVEIPDGVKWQIEEYDGLESVHEVHRSWH